MNDDFHTDNSPENEIDDRLFDRLVDGELTPNEQRRLLARLDDSPELWRRCALAFLEEQAWGNELSALQAEEEAKPPAASRQSGNAHPTGSRWLAGASWVSIAAGLLIAFALGALAQRSWRDTEHQPSANPLARQADENTNGLQQPQPTTVFKQPVQPSGQMTLVVDRGQDQDQQTIDLPVYDARQLDDSWTRPPELPAEFLRAMQRTGHQVRRNQQYLPFRLEDGRNVVVPVEEIEIVPVGGRRFQ